ncbi:hypothetical protein [Mesobacillus maritimus]|uniref:Spore coat protein n=1 Tax=Mesobacillus maritimus TaxID=1643336 RepID=A0ABS7K1G3_9BACI|nr:hypothetical protein [Mesobacillus maritimus]MBY0096097.1 hypothetical protein [Mesobacillus maritimus]
MKRFIILPTIFILSLIAATVYAADKQAQNEIVQELMDVTGDGKDDTITITGVPFEEGSLFLKEISMKIKTSEGEKFHTELEGGYEPSLAFKDFNHDGVKDVLVRVETGGSGGTSNYELYSFKDAKQVDMGVPEPLTIISQFEEGYKASIQIEETGKLYTFNLFDRKEKYDRLGLYQNGKLNEPMELMVLPYSTLKPVFVHEKQIGFKGVQRISGVGNVDTIGFVESSWILENGEWKQTDTKVQKSLKTKKKKKNK